MIRIDYRDKRPIYEQVVEKIQALILNGVLEADMQLPSVRKMAMDLSINPNTIQKSYNLLEQMGLTYSIKGKGCYISPNLEMLDLQLEQYYKKFKEVVEQGREKGISEEKLIHKMKIYYKETNDD